MVTIHQLLKTSTVNDLNEIKIHKFTEKAMSMIGNKANQRAVISISHTLE